MSVENKKFLDSEGLSVLWSLIKKEIVASPKATVNTTSYWNDKSIIPLPGEIIIYSDYKTTTDESGNVKYIQNAKIGDGRTLAKDLDFLIKDNAASADKVNHKLAIGNYEYDGSAEVRVPVYGGEVSIKN